MINQESLNAVIAAFSHKKDGHMTLDYARIVNVNGVDRIEVKVSGSTLDHSTKRYNFRKVRGARINELGLKVNWPDKKEGESSIYALIGMDDADLTSGPQNASEDNDNDGEFGPDVYAWYVPQLRAA